MKRFFLNKAKSRCFRDTVDVIDDNYWDVDRLFIIGRLMKSPERKAMGKMLRAMKVIEPFTLIFPSSL